MKNHPELKRDPQVAARVLVSTLLFFVASAAYSAPVKNDSTQTAKRYSIAAGYDKTYSFSDLQAHSQGNAILVSGRVKSAGKQLQGHIDIAFIDSSGKLLKKVSVKPYFNNRPAIGTKYMVGFPFRATMQLNEGTTANGQSIRLALHRDSERKDTVYDCGANKAVQETGKRSGVQAFER